MAANIPAKLKQAGITPFIVRANQLEAAKPVISYWCKMQPIRLMPSVDFGPRY
jgi:vacuolar protein sorting-associated protein VTA1